MMGVGEMGGGGSVCGRVEGWMGAALGWGRGDKVAAGGVIMVTGAAYAAIEVRSEDSLQRRQGACVGRSTYERPRPGWALRVIGPSLLPDGSDILVAVPAALPSESQERFASPGQVPHGAKAGASAWAGGGHGSPRVHWR